MIYVFLIVIGYLAAEVLGSFIKWYFNRDNTFFDTLVLRIMEILQKIEATIVAKK